MATSITIGSGTTYDISAGQTDSGDTVQSGGTVDVDAGGTASETIVLGTEGVLSGGIDVGAVVASGGLEIVASGGTASGTVIQGGTLDLEAGGILAGSMSFAGGGTLEIDGASMPTATISGFSIGQTIDLRGLAFGAASSAVLTGGNVLQISEGGQSVALQLDPAQSYAGHGFALANDGHGGTALIDPLQTTFTVGSEGATFGNTDPTTLNGAIRLIDTSGVAGTPYTINITGTISLSNALLAINLPSGVTSLTIEGTSGGGGGVLHNQTINGGGTERGLFVYSGTVVLDDLTIQSATAAARASAAGCSSRRPAASRSPMWHSPMMRRGAEPAVPGSGAVAAAPEAVVSSF